MFLILISAVGSRLALWPGGSPETDTAFAAPVVPKPPSKPPVKLVMSAAHETRYAAIGDSYSCGEGATPDEAWPVLLTSHLRATGRPVRLVSNPSVTGWTTQQAIDLELPEFKAVKPQFATLLIGANDYFQGVDATTFRVRLQTLMNGMQSVLPDKRRILVVTIPDYSVTPAGASFSVGRDAGAGIRAFNAIIAEEAKLRGLPVVDIYPLSLAMATDSTFVARDGLHPSAREYAEWEKVIFPAAVKMLGEK